MSRTNTEARKAAVRRYDDANTRQYHLKLNRKTDADIIALLDRLEKKQTFIKEAIRQAKTGAWIEYPAALQYEGAYLPEHIVCSACFHVFCTLDNCTEEFHHCPHCGAKMN